MSRPDGPNSQAQPDQSSDAPVVQDLGGGITATVCKNKYNIKTWDDTTSKYAFCERLGFRFASCDMPPRVDAPMSSCDWRWAKQDRWVEIANECMTRDFDVANVPSMIEGMEACVCGEGYAETGRCYTRQCDEKLTCLQSAGLKLWTTQRAQARK